MHWHITRNGVVPSWAWTARTRRAAQTLVTNFRRHSRRTTYDLLRCPEPLCPDYREWQASLGPELPAPAYQGS